MAAAITTAGDMPGEAHKPLVDSIKSLFDHPEFNDFVITCEGKCWKVHKAIVATRSDFFRKACDGQFKEGQSGLVNLPDDDKCIVHEMLRYLYTGDYQDTTRDDKDSQPTPMLFNVHMHTIADKYNIPALVQLAEVKFEARTENEWNTEDFANAIEEMYATAADSKKAMHLCAVHTAAGNAKALYETKVGKRFQEVIKDTPEFLSELAARMASGKSKKKRGLEDYAFKCSSCRCSFVSAIEPSRSYVYCTTCGITISTSNATVVP